jgi:hypothetical protein
MSRPLDLQDLKSFGTPQRSAPICNTEGRTIPSVVTATVAPSITGIAIRTRALTFAADTTSGIATSARKHRLSGRLPGEQDGPAMAGIRKKKRRVSLEASVRPFRSGPGRSPEECASVNHASGFTHLIERTSLVRMSHFIYKT